MEAIHTLLIKHNGKAIEENIHRMLFLEGFMLLFHTYTLIHSKNFTHDMVCLADKTVRLADQKWNFHRRWPK